MLARKFIALNGRPKPFRVVSAGLTPPFDPTAVTTQVQSICDVEFFLGADIDEGYLTFDNWWVNSTGGFTDNDQALQIVKCAILNSGRTINMPVKFGGQAGATVPIGGNDFRSDTFRLSDFAIPRTRNTQLWLRCSCLLAGAGNFPHGQRGTTGSKSFVYDPTLNVGYDPVYLTGTLTNPTSGTNQSTFYIGPTALMARHSAPGFPAHGVAGDSWTNGTGDSGANLIGSGFAAKSSLDAGVATNTIGLLRLFRGGITAAGWVGNTKLQTYLKHLKSVTVELGINDIGGDGSGNVTTLHNNLLSIYAMCRANRVQSIVGCYMPPRATSSDLWRTTANQTPKTVNHGAGGKTETHNTQIDADKAAGIINAIMTFNDARASATKSDANYFLWAVDGSANYATDDDTHSNLPIVTLNAVEHRALVLALPSSGY